MILLFALFTIQFGWASAGNQDYPNVSVEIENSSLVSIFSKLNATTNFRFSYGESILLDHGKNSVVCNNKQLDVVLDDLSKDANLSYLNKSMMQKKLGMVGLIFLYLDWEVFILCEQNLNSEKVMYLVL